jgi:membrane associated rhomboid family serine protease
MPPITRALLLLNVVVFGVQQLTGFMLIGQFALWPPASGLHPAAYHFQVWQILTYSFLHGSIAHLFFNMLALYMFGGDIERLLGSRRFLTYYLVCVVGAAITQLLVMRGMREPQPTIGASGGVFGLLLAFGMAYPHRKVLLLFPPIPMPAWLFVTLYGLLELFLGVTGTTDGVAHFAHLGGMAAGFALLTHWARSARER